MYQKLYETKVDKSSKLEIAMKYLGFVDKAQGAAFYLEESLEIMQQLHQDFQKEQYLPWVKNAFFREDVW